MGLTASLARVLTDRFVVVTHLATAWKASRLAECPSLVCGSCPEVVTDRVPPALEKGVEALRLGYAECLDRARECRVPAGPIILFLFGVLVGLLIAACLLGGLLLFSPLRRQGSVPAITSTAVDETVVKFSGPSSPLLRR
jgi:hypothetical protein